MSKKIIVLFLLLLLSACGVFGSYYEAEPVGVGKNYFHRKAWRGAQPGLEG